MLQNKWKFICLGVLLTLCVFLSNLLHKKFRLSYQVEERPDRLDRIWSQKLKYTQMLEKVTKEDLNLFSRLQSVRKSCGDVCRTDIPGTEAKYYDLIRKNVDCLSLFSNPLIDANSEHAKPPEEIPTYLHSEFTHGGGWKVVNDYRDESKTSTRSVYWGSELIDAKIREFRENTLQGYGRESVILITEHLKMYGKVNGKTGLVIGSQIPWLEGLLLGLGAKRVVTLDYTNITSGHPQHEGITPSDLLGIYSSGVKYDFVASFSSIEHSGLGRYGDMLNPWGDLIAMARAWCLVKPGGYGLIGVPYGPEILGFNSHRIYGPLGLAQLFANWEVVFTEAHERYNKDNTCSFCYQPIHSLRRLP